MRFLIWGAGAIGGTLGAHLARAGHDITFVDSDAEHVAVIARDGLAINGPISHFTARAPAVAPGQLAGLWDTIILATKAHHTVDATRALLPHLSANGCVVSAQNGLNPVAIAEIAGAERTVGALVNFGADCVAPGVIHFGGRGALAVGELDGRTTSRAQAICEAWRDFDAGTTVTPDIWGHLWSKEAYGAMLFATALTDEPIADVLAMPDARCLCIVLAREVLAVASARGVALEPFDGFDPAAYSPAAPVGAALRSLDDLVAFNRRSAKTHSGVWRDLAVRKRRTEVDAQLGIVVTLGHATGVPTPMLERLVELIHEVERGALPQSLSTLRLLTPVDAEPGAARA
jgi:2-dehydropantoate 2-reductase